MIEFTDQRGKPVYINPRHVKVLTDNGSGGTQVWLEYETPHFPGSRSSFLNVVQPPSRVARAIRMALHPRTPGFIRPRRARAIEKDSPGVTEVE